MDLGKLDEIRRKFAAGEEVKLNPITEKAVVDMKELSENLKKDAIMHGNKVATAFQDTQKEPENFSVEKEEKEENKEMTSANPQEGGKKHKKTMKKKKNGKKAKKGKTVKK